MSSGDPVTEKRRYCRPKNHDTTVYGRDSSGRCLACKKEAGRAARYLRIAEDRGIREAERRRREEEEQAAREGVLRRRREEAERAREREYRAALEAGGRIAAEAKWQRAFDETLEKTGGRYGLCRWEDEVDGKYLGPMCYRRTTDVYCHVHNRQLERETERRRKAQESEDRAAAPVQPAAPRVRRRPSKHGRRSGWAAYKAQHPDRARFYASSTWRSMRERQLRDYPTCVVCGQKAGHADHVLAIALGGTIDGRLQSMCAKHHHEKTVGDSHEAAKMAAARRKNPR